MQFASFSCLWYSETENQTGNEKYSSTLHNIFICLCLSHLTWHWHRVHRRVLYSVLVLHGVERHKTNQMVIICTVPVYHLLMELVLTLAKSPPFQLSAVPFIPYHHILQASQVKVPERSGVGRFIRPLTRFFRIKYFHAYMWMQDQRPDYRLTCSFPIGREYCVNQSFSNISPAHRPSKFQNLLSDFRYWPSPEWAEQETFDCSLNAGIAERTRGTTQLIQFFINCFHSKTAARLHLCASRFCPWCPSLHSSLPRKHLNECSKATLEGYSGKFCFQNRWGNSRKMHPFIAVYIPRLGHSVSLGIGTFRTAYAIYLSSFCSRPTTHCPALLLSIPFIFSSTETWEVISISFVPHGYIRAASPRHPLIT